MRRTRAILCACILLFGIDVSVGTASIRGLPFSRDYSLEDIGYVPRGSRLGFDAFGRVAVIHDGVYIVLNDTVWLNLTDAVEARQGAIVEVVQGPDGKLYYGGLGSWGRAEIKSDGKLHAIPLLPENPPSWTRIATFHDVLVTDDGIYFASTNGVVYWDVRKGESQLFEMNELSKAFLVGQQVYVSSFEQPLRVIDLMARTTHDIPSAVLDGNPDNVVERATTLDGNRALVSRLDGRMFVFDGTRATPWPGQLRNDLRGRISALQLLADGNIAVSIAERGVFVLSRQGELLRSLTIPQYHRVSDIASREPGVMWLINEHAVEKVLYFSGLTWFGQRLGLSLEWPIVASWNDRIMVASFGVLYEAIPSSPESTTRFERPAVQPPNGAWALAAWGPHLLVGNATHVYSATPDRRFLPVASFKNLAQLVMVDEGLCFAIGRSEIALLRWDGERWIEPAPRISGVRFPSVVHRAGRSAWIEMGGDGVARVSFDGGQLNLMVAQNEPWTKSLWVNVGVVNDMVVLTGARGERRFFSETTETWCEEPDLDQLLDRSREWLVRMRSDAEGNIWATYDEGVVRFTPKGSDYDFDALTYDLISDRYPIIRVLPDDDVWVSASRSLYHVDPIERTGIRPFPEPVLVSLVDARQNVELLTPRTEVHRPRQFPYSQNNLTFRFFSGGYASRRTPDYEFRLNPNEPWFTLDTSSLLRFPALHPGRYTLEVRVSGRPGVPGAPLTLPFEILPPWYRTWPAYVFCGLAILLVAGGVIRLFVRMARQRSRALEQLVRDRTSQLESTMRKLNEEARNAATLAERNRLAEEIHDSVQQGLSGAILQLDTTLTLASVAGNLRARLNVVRNMVSYARQEVQHAVWDMDSPLLEGNDLSSALRKLAAFASSDNQEPRFEVSGSPVDLPRSATHPLLRIAQEATANAIRHAHARAIVIRLEYQAEAVSLTISDDGVGFDPETVLNQAGHFGLRGMRTRARKLSASLNITSSPGEGTAIQVLLPLTLQQSNNRDADANHPQQNPNPACR